MEISWKEDIINFDETLNEEFEMEDLVEVKRSLWMVHDEPWKKRIVHILI